MKTVRQIADELGVSKETIRKQVSNLPPNLVTIGGNRIRLIASEGIEIIKNNMPKHNAEKVTTGGGNQVPIMVLVEMLKTELETKNNQIAELTAALIAAQGLHAGTIQNTFPESIERPKKKIFGLFRW